MLLLAFQTTTCEKSLSESSVNLIQYFIKVFQKRVNIIIIVLVIVAIPIVVLEYPGEKQLNLGLIGGNKVFVTICHPLLPTLLIMIVE